jgi:hypothetical protein
MGKGCPCKWGLDMIQCIPLDQGVWVYEVIWVMGDDTREGQGQVTHDLGTMPGACCCALSQMWTSVSKV